MHKCAGDKIVAVSNRSEVRLKNNNECKKCVAAHTTNEKTFYNEVRPQIDC